MVLPLGIHTVLLANAHRGANAHLGASAHRGAFPPCAGCSPRSSASDHQFEGAFLQKAFGRPSVPGVAS